MARFAAALFVAVDHTAGLTNTLTGDSSGFDLPPIPSVMFFFTLSGFVMLVAHGKDFGRLSRIPIFFWRRFCRIYPIYWLSLAANLYVFWRIISWPYLFKTLSLWPFQTSIVEINPPAWSLRFEMSFYLMFGICLLPVIGRFWLAGWIFTVLWCWYPWAPPFSWLHFLHLHLHLPDPVSWHFFGIHVVFFFTGLAAGQALRRWRIPVWSAWLLILGAAVSLIFMIRLDEWGYGYPSVNRAPFEAAAFAILIFALATAERAGGLRMPRRLAWLGAMSYPLYLFHPMVLFLATLFSARHAGALHALGGPALFLLLLAAALLLSAAVTFLIDQPLQRFLRRPYSPISSRLRRSSSSV